MNVASLKRRVRNVRYVATLLSLLTLQSVACDADPGYRGRTSEEWIAQLNHPGDPSSVASKVDAAVALAEILRIRPGSERVTRALVQALGDSADDVRLAAGTALAQPGVDASKAVQGLIDVAYDSAHAEVRASALRLLGDIVLGMRAPEAERHLHAIVRVWADALSDPSFPVRSASADALEHTGAALRPHSALLIAGLQRLALDPDARLRAGAVSILPSVAIRDTLAHAMYTSALHDPASSVREAALRSAGRLADVDAFLLRAITAALDDTASAVRRAAVATLGARDVRMPDEIRIALQGAQADADSAVRTEATHALERFHQRGGVDVAPREPTLAERCRDLPPRTRGC